ncbi:MAG: DUF3037 domain-containing protein [bacterium]
MKTNKVVCNYAIVRFLPYPETEEFVNLGVVVACPSQQYFDFRLETIKRDRVTGFFPELNDDVLIKGRRFFQVELERVRECLKAKAGKQAEFAFSNAEFSRLFREVVKPRESLFRYSSIGIRLADSPSEALKYLYDHYVERMFAKQPEYQEVEMVRRLRQTLLAARIRGFKAGHIGNEMYEVPFPLLRRTKEDEHNFRAIKPLDLDKDKPTAITVHGDDWLAKLGHLKEMQYDAGRMLFAVHMPKGDAKKCQAAEEICRKFEASGALVAPSDSIEEITSFAQAI